MSDLGPIILPPAPRPGRNPAENKARLDEWTRQAEQAIRKIWDAVQGLSSAPPPAGLPVGGTTAQVLAKNSGTDGDAGWFTPHYIPAAGTSGQVLSKNSGTDYDVAWTDSPGGLPTGGTTGQALRKNSGTDFDASFLDVHEVPSGGTTGQFLAKNSSTNYDVSWTSAPVGLPTGGTTRQALLKNSSTNFDASFLDIHEVPAGGSASQVLTKNSSTNYDASWITPVTSAYVDSQAQWREMYLCNLGGTAASSVGVYGTGSANLTASTITSTAGSSTTGRLPTVNMATVAGSGNRAFFNTTQIHCFYSKSRMLIGDTRDAGLTARRLWIAAADYTSGSNASDLLSKDLPTLVPLIGFRMASTDTHVQAATGNGSALTLVDTGVPVGSEYLLEARWEQGCTSVDFYVNGNKVATITTTLPPVATTFGVGMWLTTLSASAYTMKFSFVKLLQQTG